MNPINSAGIFLISSLFDLVIFLFLIRALLIYCRVDFYNPISQVVIKFTQKIAVSFRKFLPNFRNLESASLFIVIILEILKFFILGLIMGGLPNPVGVGFLAIADTLKFLINIFFYAIIIQVILSWVNPGYTPVSDVINRITQIVTRPFQRLIPPVSGLDLSPIPALILLQLLLILIVNPLLQAGWMFIIG